MRTLIGDYSALKNECLAEGKAEIVLAFADEDGLAEVESRLASLARDGRATRADLLYALQGFDHWTPDDRMGAALRQLGFPADEPFVYRMSKLWFTLVTATGLNEVEHAFQRNREKWMGERSNNRWISNNDRKPGTLQVSRWIFGQPIAIGQRVFVVVTRQDTPWTTMADAPESYALTAVLSDRENDEVNLYAQVQTQLEARAQARARARV